MSIEFKDAINNQLIEPHILEHIPRKCKCGADLVIDDQFHNIVCQSNKCDYITALRLNNLINYLGETSISIEECFELVRKHKLSQPYQVIQLSKHGIDKLRTIAKSVQSNEYSVYQIVEMGAPREIRGIAKELFRGASSIKEAYAYIKIWPIQFIANRLGMTTDEQLKLAYSIQEKLIQLEKELKYAESLFKIKAPQNIISLMIDKELDNFRDSNELIEYLEEKYHGDIEINLVPQVFSGLNACISDKGVQSRKFSNIDNLDNDCVFTVDSFISNLDGELYSE